MECVRRVWCATQVSVVLVVLLGLVGLVGRVGAGPRYSSRIVHTHTGAIRGIIVEPASRRLEPVEVFRGVPYGARPPRLGPPPPPDPWPGTRLADTFPPVCPQRYPDISNKSAALSKMPLGIYNELKATIPLLVNQSEDCLYLNIFVPGSGARGVEAPYAVVVVVGGAHEWGSGNSLDGAVLAARAHLLVITINYRIGLLGYLTTGTSDEVSAAGGAAVLDMTAALSWVNRNIAAFGGDPKRLTLLGHGAGAALVNVILMLPSSKGLITRALLLSGSALSPSALAPDAALAREHTAQALRCSKDTNMGEHWLATCIRSRPLAVLLAVEAPHARFLAGWAPCPPAQPTRALHASETFLQCSLAVVVTTTESYQFFSEDDIRHGFEEEHRSRILRTYVRNVYRYHRNEIFAAIRNEYTDWEKPIQHPINIRDATLEALSDAAVAAPALRLAQLHAKRGARTYLAHFTHQTKDADYPQRLGSVTSESLPYFLGLPLVGGMPFHPRNYSRGDVSVAETTVMLLAAFAKTGDPSPKNTDKHDSVNWPEYDLNTQQYLSIGTKVRTKSHYRGHKMALWLHLVPQLHRPGAAPRHHQFRSLHPDMFAGEIFPELHTTPSLEEESTEEEPEVEECEPSPSARPALSAMTTPQPTPKEDSLTNLDSQYYSYTVALGVTVGAGCFLLALNLLVFAGIYLQREKRRANRRPRREGSCSSRSGSAPIAEPTITSPRKSTLKQRGRIKRETGKRAAKKTRSNTRDFCVDDF
ncbi:neuroligin-2-like isoform X1 [Danaus plexippus]|uniref:neuroligin-2-like isoform X1 n=1 Tax=Danaus plexippus TaxID=13037 RepID=UPI0013C48765|nr:neuroligin-2-like isoform X1 [Danaus plexippus]